MSGIDAPIKDSRPRAELLPAKIDAKPLPWSEELARARKSLAPGTVFACLAGAACAAGVLSLAWPKPEPIVARAVSEVSPLTQPARAEPLLDPLAAPEPETGLAWWRARPEPKTLAWPAPLDPNLQRALAPQALREPSTRPAPELQTGKGPGLERTPGFSNITTPGAKKKGFLELKFTPTKSVILGAILAMGRIPGNSLAPGSGNVPGNGPVHHPNVETAHQPPPRNLPAAQPATEGPGEHAVQPAPAHGPGRDPPQPRRGMEAAGSSSTETSGSDGPGTAPGPPSDGVESPPPADGGGDSGIAKRSSGNDQSKNRKVLLPPIPPPRPLSTVATPVPYCQLRPTGAWIPGVTYNPNLPFCDQVNLQGNTGAAASFGIEGSTACNSAESSATAGVGDAASGDGDGGGGGGGGD